MAQLQDCSIMVEDESTYGTAVTVARPIEFTDEDLDYDKGVKQGQGMRVGSRLARIARRVVTTKAAKGSVTFELYSKGQGKWWKYLLGSMSSTLVSGSTYQQVGKLGATTDALQAFTLQKGVVRDDGTVDPYTVPGCLVDSWELTAAQGEIATVKATIDGREVLTATGYASPSYVATPTQFHFAQGSMAFGTGAITMPTTTALASGGTNVLNITDFSMSVDRKLKKDRFPFGLLGKKSKPTSGMPEIKGKVTVEYTDQTTVNAFLADTTFGIILDFDTGVALSAGNERLQIVLPAIKLEGELPKANKGELIELSVDFTVGDDLTNAPLTVVLRTSDTAL